MTAPIFSVVIANYNYGRFLDEAIQSVIAQNLGGLVELIICDAASEDDSVSIIKKYANGLPPNTFYEEWIPQNNSRLTAHNSQLITWWCSEKDAGQSAAFNKGFSHARGKFLTWLNADDVFTRGALKSVLDVIEKNPKCEWIAGSSIYSDVNLKVTKCFCAHRFSDIRARWGFLSAWGPSSFFTKRLIDRVGGVDESLHYLMDIDLWHRFYSQCNARYAITRKTLFVYRHHEASKMSGASVKISKRGIENRCRAKAEEHLVNRRYGINKDGWRYRLAHWASFSFIDMIIALFRTFYWRGCDAREI